MNDSKPELRQRILELLRHYDADSTFDLIKGILINWGRALAAIQLPPPTDGTSDIEFRMMAGTVPGTFINRLEHVDLASTQAQTENPGRELTVEEIDAEGAKWGKDLAQLPFDETMAVFVSAVREWMLTCDLTSFREDAWTDEEIRDRMVYWWGTYLAVY